jgi:hypothetical protein
MANQSCYRICANVSSTSSHYELKASIHPSHLDLLTRKQDPRLPKKAFCSANLCLSRDNAPCIYPLYGLPIGKPSKSRERTWAGKKEHNSSFLTYCHN